MAKADQIKALIRCHAEGDDARFYAVAMQVAAQAARSGHGNFTQELRELVDQAKARSKAAASSRSPHPVPLAQPRGGLAGLLTVRYPKTRLSDMALSDSLAGPLAHTPEGAPRWVRPGARAHRQEDVGSDPPTQGRVTATPRAGSS